MKKCSYCGVENSDESLQCRQCQTPLDNSAGPALRRRQHPFRKMLPYLLSYSVVASGVFLYDHVMGQRRGVPFPPHFLVLNTSLSIDELVARLARAGVPKESVLGALAPKPDAGLALVHHFELFGVALFAFWALTQVFKKMFTK